MTAPTKTVAAEGALVGTPGRPARPAGYWERVDRIVAAAPALSDHQRAVIRTAFAGTATREAA